MLCSATQPTAGFVGPAQTGPACGRDGGLTRASLRRRRQTWLARRACIACRHSWDAISDSIPEPAPGQGHAVAGGFRDGALSTTTQKPHKASLTLLTKYAQFGLRGSRLGDPKCGDPVPTNSLLPASNQAHIATTTSQPTSTTQASAGLVPAALIFLVVARYPTWIDRRSSLRQYFTGSTGPGVLTRGRVLGLANGVDRVVVGQPGRRAIRRLRGRMNRCHRRGLRPRLVAAAQIRAPVGRFGQARSPR